jgi:hypothetical protein
MHKYSDWQKIDLHIHTDWSRKTKEGDYQGLFDVVTLKSKLIENKVDIFSLTDHNIINIDAYREYYETYNEAVDPLLLVGVELDIKVQTLSYGLKTYHSLIIFNYCDVENAQRIHDLLEKKYTDEGIPDKQRCLDIDQVIELFPEDDFFFIPHAGNTKSILSGYRENMEDAQKMVLLMPSAFEKVPAKARQKYDEGFNKVLEYDFQSRNDIPYINFSDNHNIHQYPCTNKGGPTSKVHEFYYLKGSKNYETIRLSFIDPESRIFSETRRSEVEDSNNYLEGIKISENGLLDSSDITFSPHLNVLIGGRSSGKSLLMSLIGKGIDSVEIDFQKYNIESEVLIKTIKDSDFQKEVSIPTESVLFIKQGDIVKYFEEQRLGQLAIDADKSEEYDNALVFFKKQKQELELLIDRLISAYDDMKGLDFMRQFKLHNSQIKKIISKQFLLNFDFETLLKEVGDKKKICEAKETVDRLNNDVIKFKLIDLFEINDDENLIITQFENLLKSKEVILNQQNLSFCKKENFINLTNDLIVKSNDKMGGESKAKQDALIFQKTLINDISDKLIRIKKFKIICTEVEDFRINSSKEIKINEQVDLVLEIDVEEPLRNFILEGLASSINKKSLFHNLSLLATGKIKIKNHANSDGISLKRKITRELTELFKRYDNPSDYLDYHSEGTSKKNSPGYNSEKYLQIILNSPTSEIIFIDQPEDNLGNSFISDDLVKIL